VRKTVADLLYDNLMSMADGVPHRITRVHDEIQIAPLSTVEAALAADREAALRDVFATAALAAVIPLLGLSNFSTGHDLAASYAYSYADAMMKMRKGWK
jgi:hypothetical protein